MVVVPRLHEKKVLLGRPTAPFTVKERPKPSSNSSRLVFNALSKYSTGNRCSDIFSDHGRIRLVVSFLPTYFICNCGVICIEHLKLYVVYTEKLDYTARIKNLYL